MRTAFERIAGTTAIVTFGLVAFGGIALANFLDKVNQMYGTIARTGS